MRSRPITIITTSHEEKRDGRVLAAVAGVRLAQATKRGQWVVEVAVCLDVAADDRTLQWVRFDDLGALQADEVGRDRVHRFSD